MSSKLLVSMLALGLATGGRGGFGARDRGNGEAGHQHAIADWGHPDAVPDLDGR